MSGWHKIYHCPCGHPSMDHPYQGEQIGCITCQREEAMSDDDGIPMVTMIADTSDSQPRVVDTMVLKLMAQEVYDVNVEKGWYDGPRTFGEDIALLHSEVSEMLEAFRDHGTDDATQVLAHTGHYEGDSLVEGVILGKPEGVGSEAADVLIRLLDTCKRYDIDLFAEWRRKVTFNWTRPARHGGKRL